MNHPLMSGLRLNAPSHVKHARLTAWVAEIAALTQAADVVCPSFTAVGDEQGPHKSWSHGMQESTDVLLQGVRL